MTATPETVPSHCPVCGAYSLAPDIQISSLLAVCDVLTLKSLSALGNRIKRVERSRHRILGARPDYEAHTIWAPDDEMVDKALKGAWDVVPALLGTHGCCDVTTVQVTELLNSYVHDLAITGTVHTIDELRYRFVAHLGLPVFGGHDDA